MGCARRKRASIAGCGLLQFTLPLGCASSLDRKQEKADDPHGDEHGQRGNWEPEEHQEHAGDEHERAKADCGCGGELDHSFPSIRYGFARVAPKPRSDARGIVGTSLGRVVYSVVHRTLVGGVLSHAMLSFMPPAITAHAAFWAAWRASAASAPEPFRHCVMPLKVTHSSHSACTSDRLPKMRAAPRTTMATMRAMARPVLLGGGPLRAER